MLRFPHRGATLFSLLLGWIIAILSCHSSLAQAHSPRFEHLSVADGLSQSEVITMLQDVHGFLWFGTTDGLNRYDGYGFSVFRQSSKAPLSLSDDNIRHLRQDRSGDIWICTMHGGLNRYVYHTGRFLHHYSVNSFLTSNMSFVSTMTPINDTMFVLGTSDGKILLFNPDADTYYIHPTVGSGNAVTALAQTPDGVVWAGTWGSGLHSLQIATGKIASYFHGRGADDLPHNTLNALLVDRRGKLWIGTGNGLARLNSRGTFDRFMHRAGDKHSLSNNEVTSLYEDASGQIWVGTSDGINMLEPGEGTFISFQHDPIDPSSLSSGRVYAMMQDDSGVLWFAATGSGLNKLLLRRPSFETYSTLSPRPFHLPGNDVMGIAETDQGALYVALFDAGLVKLDQKTGTAQRVEIVPKGTRALHLDRNHNLWVGTETNGLYVLNLSTGRTRQFKHDPHNPHTISNNEIRKIFEDTQGTIWIGTFAGGLNRFDASTSRFTQIRHRSPHLQAGVHLSIMEIFEDESGTLWVGTNGGGLSSYDPVEKTLTAATASLTGRYDLRMQFVFGIAELEPGVLWLATYGSGLMRYEPGTGSLTRISEDDGFPSSSLYDILPDNSGNLWISSNNGLIRYTPRTGAVKNFTIMDGLQSSEFNRGARYKSKSGRMFFGGVAGFNTFFPDSIKEDLYIPRVVITSFRVFDEPFTFSQTPAHAPITLEHDQNFISFEFASLDYRTPQKILYTYKLEGVDREWVEPSNRRYARYTHLDPGEYVFNIKATNSDGIWNPEPTTFAVVIRPPLYGTWWFRIGIILTIAGLLYYLYRVRMEKMLAIERMRVRIASDLHDDVGAALTKISLYTDLLKANSNTDGVVERIGTMSREIIASMSDIVWAIDARNDTLGDLIDRINYYASDVFAAKGIHLEFGKADFSKPVTIPVEYRQNLYLILKEAVNNIAKHSGATCASIRFAREGGKVVIVVKDNGSGFGEALRPSGQGLRNMQMRAARSNAALTIEHRQGTEIRLKTAIRI